MLAAGNFVGVVNVNMTREHRLFTPGQLKNMSILASILAPILQSSLLFREVSEAEAKYRSIIENALEGIFQTTPEGKYLSVNPALARMYGYDSPEELMKSVTDLQAQQYVNPEDRDRLKALYEEHGFVEGFETEVYKRDGDRVWISMNARAAKTEQGQPLSYEGTTQDITSRKKAEAELHAARERLQILSRSLLQKMEAERHMIARELHDEIGQALTAVKLNLQSLKRQCRDRAAVSAFPESIGIIDKALEQVRSLSLNLRPSVLDDLGLVPAIRWLVDHMGRSAKLQIELTYDTVPRLPVEIETACFRIAQESITNAIRHAKAKNIVMGLHADDEALHLSVRDNGIGFDTTWAQTQAVHGGSIGLLGMQERAALVEGSISIDSTPGEGTEMKAHFPMRRE
jgi:PAS domain S-box-containing protein